MGGGIIINRSSVLLKTATDSNFYPFLSDHMRARVDAIEAKAPGDRTEADCEFLAAAILVATHT